jgi:hypothetical protein
MHGAIGFVGDRQSNLESKHDEATSIGERMLNKYIKMRRRRGMEGEKGGRGEGELRSGEGISGMSHTTFEPLLIGVCSLKVVAPLLRTVVQQRNSSR